MVAGIFMAVLHTEVKRLLRAAKHGSVSDNYIHGGYAHKGEGRKTGMMVAGIFMAVLYTELKRLLRAVKHGSVSDNYIHGGSIHSGEGRKA